MTDNRRVVTPTAPVPIAPPSHDRDPAGLFAAGSAEQVIRNLRQDLLALGVSFGELYAQFSAGTAKYVVGSSESPSQGDMSELAQRLEDDKLDESDLLDLVHLLYFAGYQRLLAKHHLRFPAYNILDDYFTNATGPSGPRVLPRPQVVERSWSLFGKRIGFPIGVPASVLTGGSAWVQYFAGNGFNVLTYKTVRSRAHAPNQPPNWAFVPDEREPFKVSDEGYKLMSEPYDWVDPGSRDVTTANSFGVPSPAPYEWMADVANALTVLADDQLLIVSVMGDDYDSEIPRLETIALDFAETAKMAEKAGATVVELNLSCPNSLDTSAHGVKPPLCFDPDVTTAIIEKTRAELNGSTSIVAKLSYLNEARLSTLVHRIAPMVDGIAGINTLQCTVSRSNGDPTFPGRSLAGVSGIAVQDYARDFVARLSRLRLETGHYFEILGMGGVTDPESFEALFDLGASVVQTASGAFANPFLAAECVEALGRNLPDVPPIYDPEMNGAIKSAILNSLDKAGHLSQLEVASALPLRVEQTYGLFAELEESGEIVRLLEDVEMYRRPS